MVARLDTGRSRRIKILKTHCIAGYNATMLTRLYISNIVLIEKLNLEFGAGLNVLTGETGAGKSILLDALALALGARSDVGLVRHGCDASTVIAEFDTITDELKRLLDENGLEFEDALILRRTLSNDGKSRAWINDTPVSIKTLKQIGDMLVEIHGQFANHTLLDPTTHRESLDLFGIKKYPEYKELLNSVDIAYQEYNSARRRLDELVEMLEKSANERDFLEHNVNELRTLNVRIGEEDELATRRATLMNAEKNTEILSDAINALCPNGESLDSRVFSVAHILQRCRGDANPYQEQIDALYDVGQRLSEISEQLTPADTDTDDLESVEERLFAIRAVARKHRVSADELPAKLEQMSAQLNAIENSDAELHKLQNATETARANFMRLAKKLSELRARAGTDLRTQILSELPELKLASADFMVEQTDGTPSRTGCDDITFMIKTNPGMPFAPLHKSASGGELSRLMLAMRVVLADSDNAHTFVFDEIDTGISGATASAVGSRLARLSATSQALVITHSAQVAGYADKHFKISKNSDGNTTTTTVSEISGDEHINEIARIISGAEITPESLATARTLIKQ